jgi:hypothetical protein
MHQLEEFLDFRRAWKRARAELKEGTSSDSGVGSNWTLVRFPRLPVSRGSGEGLPAGSGVVVMMLGEGEGNRTELSTPSSSSKDLRTLFTRPPGDSLILFPFNVRGGEGASGDGATSESKVNSSWKGRKGREGPLPLPNTMSGTPSSRISSVLASSKGTGSAS